MRKLALLVFAIAGAGLVLAGVSLARGGDDDHGRTSARLDGYQETPSISTAAHGSFDAQIGSSSIQYTLRYDGLEGGNVLFAHIHLGQQHTMGGVIVFLCGGGGKPACPNSPSGTVEGTITEANIVGPAGQGIAGGGAAGTFAELVRAIRAGAAYANVHTATYPTGEIRGQLRKGAGHDEGKGDDQRKKKD
jgi:hypothetical protein